MSMSTKNRPAKKRYFVSSEKIENKIPPLYSSDSQNIIGPPKINFRKN